MPQPMTTREQIQERDQRLADAEAAAQAELDRVREARANLAQQLETEAQKEAEAAALSAKSGLPIDLARRRIAAERGQVETTDAAKMTPEQYRAYRQRVHGF